MNWSTDDRRERAKAQKNWQNLIIAETFSFIFYKKISLDTCLWFILFWESRKSTVELAQTLTHRMLKVCFKWINELLLASLTDIFVYKQLVTIC